MYKNSAEKLRGMVTTFIGVLCFVIVVVAFYLFTEAVQNTGIVAGLLVVILAGAAIFSLWASNLFIVAFLDMMIDVSAIRRLLEQGRASGNRYDKTLSGRKVNDGKRLSELPATNKVVLKKDIPMSQEAKQTLINAQKIAQKRHHPWAVQEHLLFALLDSDTKKIPMLMAKLGVAPEVFKAQVEGILKNNPKVDYEPEVNVEKDLGELLHLAEKEAEISKSDSVLEEHIFLAILGCPSEEIKKIMSDFRFSKEGIFEIISKENS